MRFALDGASARLDVIDGGELIANIAGMWQVIGLDAEGLARCESNLAALPAEQLRLRARLSTTLSFLLGESGHKVRSLELATEAVEHGRASGDAALLATALQRYANAAMELQPFDDVERALANAEAIPGPSASLRLGLLQTRARLSQYRGDYETSRRIWEQLRKENRSLGNTRGAQVAAGNLAESEHASGRTPQAIAIIHEALPALRSGADTELLASHLGNLGAYLAATDDLSGALAAAREAIKIRAARELDHAYLAVAIEHVALVVALRGDLARGATLEGYAGEAFARHGFPREFTETTTHDRLTARLNESLAPDEVARLIAEGAVLTPETAIALALEDEST